MKSISDPTNLSADKRALLALLLKQQGVAATPSIPRRDPTINPPLSYSQQRLWFLDQLEPNSSVYNIARCKRVDGPLDVELVERCFREIWRRHETLRTSFPVVDGEPIQAIAPVESAPPPIWHDLSELPAAEQSAEKRRILLAESKVIFDLASGPLLRYGIVKLSAAEHLLMFTMHHIIGDGWSIGILLTEFFELYKAFYEGKESTLPELEIQYADYAVWQREYLATEVMGQQLEYWRKQLAGVPEALEFPTDHPHPSMQTTRGAYQRLQLERSLQDNLKALSDRNGATLFMTLLAAFQVLFSRYTGQTDIVVGSPIAGRTRRETEPLIGNFLNTLVLRTDLSGNPTFQELIGRVKETTLQAYSNQEVPFEKLVEELQPERDVSRTPLFQTLFIFQNMPKGLPGQSLVPEGEESAVARYGLTVELAESPDGLVIVLEYNSDLFDASTIERMMRHYGQVLAAVCRDSNQRVQEIQYLTAEEQRDLVSKWNDSALSYPSDKCLPELFAAQAVRTPHKVAVSCQGRELTYQELDERSTQLANYLHTKGIARGEFVAILVERSVEMVIALLGVLKAGAAYLPLDPVYPPERISFMLQDSAVPLVLTQSSLLSALPETSAEVLSLDRDWEAVASCSAEKGELVVAPVDLAYIIYTSGSTGQPKGVLIEHRALVNFLWSMKHEPGLTESDVLVAVTTLSFDIAGLELYLPLIVGGRLEIAPREAVVDASALSELLLTSRATVMQATPATWRMLVDSGKSIPRLKALCGGEALTRELAHQILERSTELWNMYGPTETTIWSSVHRVMPGGQSPVVELGRPIGNTQFYLLDEQKQLVPAGVAGELYIAGDGVARGYHNRPELTNEKFVPDPFAQDASALMYRTGDRVRRSSTGSLHYLERVDYQVKIRGYRIEIGDVEAALTKHENVKQAVVLARDDDRPGEKRLVAYLVGKHEAVANGNGHNRQDKLSHATANGENGHRDAVAFALPSPGEWRIFLKEFLPDYMVPARFVVLDELPLTPNGKIDRKRLPLPADTEISGDDFLAPRDSLELQLTKIWEKVLGHQPISIRDNFFDLGGHSLMAVRLFMQIEQVFERSLPLAVLFQAPTIEQLATVLREQGWSSSWSSLVPLRAVGSAPPFFCVHSLGANLVSYQSLAARMNTDQPFYGLQPAGLDGKEESHTRVEEMAAHYLKEIRALQPEGPYFLGGVCLGGTIAFEMAQQLKQAGEEVALLALIDSYRPGRIDYMPKIHWQGLPLLADYHLGNMLLRDSGQQVGYLRERARNLSARIRRVLRRDHSDTKNSEVGSFERNLRRVYEANSQAELYYKPTVYQGKITLLWSSETTTRSYLDRRLHWSELAAGGLEVHAIPGDHMSMIEEPHVNVLAGKLQTVIRNSSHEHGPGGK